MPVAKSELMRRLHERWRQERLAAPPERSYPAVAQVNLSQDQATPRLTDDERGELCTRTRQWLERHDADTTPGARVRLDVEGMRFAITAFPERLEVIHPQGVAFYYNDGAATGIRIQPRLERALLDEVKLRAAAVPGRDHEGRAATTTASRPANGFRGETWAGAEQAEDRPGL